jgi:hypothetical protein
MPHVSTLRNELIFVEDARASGVDPRDLQRACRRGELVRVRRGVYIRTSTWSESGPRDRHLLSILAVVARCHPPYLVAGRSAGVLWGLPFAAEWPEDVVLLVPPVGGGSSEPGVRRTTVSARAERGMLVDGIPATSLARTALDMARAEDFARAVAILDRAQWRRDPHATTLEELCDVLAEASFARRAAHLWRAVTFSTPLSDSPYESLARVAIHELGFEPPLLQVELRDAEGRIVPDFLWPGVAAAEFDGRVKYTRDEYTAGDPSRVVWAEKRREDRLRRMVPTVVRIVADDLSDRRRLRALLENAGIPRRERTPFVATEPLPTGSVARERDQRPPEGSPGRLDG